MGSGELGAGDDIEYEGSGVRVDERRCEAYEEDVEAHGGESVA